MKNVSDKSCRENQNIHFTFNFFFVENYVVYETMWKNILEPDRPQMNIWLMCIACWVPRATNTSGDPPKKQDFLWKTSFIYISNKKHLSPFKILSIAGNTLVQSFFPLCEASLELIKVLLGIPPACCCYWRPTFRNAVSVPSSACDEVWMRTDLYLYVRRMSGGGILTNQKEGHGKGSGRKIWVEGV